jgi:DNA-binding SARP family transcriptional activator
VWPELDAAAGDRNLRVTLTYLQRILEPERRAGEAPYFLDQDGGLLALRCSSSLWIDAAEFEALIALARRAESDGLLSQARDHWDDAVAMWRGPCLGEFIDEEWAQATSLRLTDVFLSAALRAAELHLAAGASGSTRHLAHRALEADPWSERAHRLLVEASVVDGDHAGALGAMARCEAVLADLGVAPAPETVDLCRRLRAPAGMAGLSAAAS